MGIPPRSSLDLGEQRRDLDGVLDPAGILDLDGILDQHRPFSEDAALSLPYCSGSCG